jgi:hypothetical protein
VGRVDLEHRKDAAEQFLAAPRTLIDGVGIRDECFDGTRFE